MGAHAGLGEPAASMARDHDLAAAGRGAPALLRHAARDERAVKSLVRDAARGALRVGVILCLLLAAVLLAVDSREYPGFSRAGVRALLHGALPLLGVAGLHLILLNAPSRLRDEHRRALIYVAFAVDVLMGLIAARLLRRNGAPVFALALLVALVLGAGVWSALRHER